MDPRRQVTVWKVQGNGGRWAVETLVGVVRRSAGKSVLGIDG